MYTEVCINRTGSETQAVGKPMTGVSSPASLSQHDGRSDGSSLILSAGQIVEDTDDLKGECLNAESICD